MADAMDSKSISRKGVGVQVPALVPPFDRPGREDADRTRCELARELWPAAIARVRQLERRARELAASRADSDGLAELDLTLADLGFVFAWLGWCMGVDAPVARAHPRGLALVRELIVGDVGSHFEEPRLACEPRIGLELIAAYGTFVRARRGDVGRWTHRVERGAVRIDVAREGCGDCASWFAPRACFEAT